MMNPSGDSPADRRAPLVYEQEGRGGIAVGGAATLAVAIAVPDVPTPHQTGS